MTNETLRLVQLTAGDTRRIALVREPDLVLIDGYSSVYELALSAITRGITLQYLVAANPGTEVLNYDSVYTGNSAWKLLPSFDHPEQVLSCLVSGTGLTHKNSALNRQMMHTTGEKPTDSLVMYQWGVEGGTPAAGEIGVQPEWFYKGNGSVLTGHGDSLHVPAFANDGGEEPEVAGIYIIGPDGQPYRIGFTTGNEFSDHVMEQKNYLYLAPSKLRNCSIGPELVIAGDFAGFTGTVKIQRDDRVIWSAAIQSGEKNMAHNLANLEYHHFKYPGHRIPLQSHVHFFGADAFSFGNGLALQDNDKMSVEWNELGRPLVNTLRLTGEKEQPVSIRTL